MVKEEEEKKKKKTEMGKKGYQQGGKDRHSVTNYINNWPNA
jgi:hypothetical protein